MRDCEFCGAPENGVHSQFCKALEAQTRPEEAPPDASDPSFVRRRISEAKRREASTATVIRQIMASDTGRAWVYEKLSMCHVFQSSFSPNALDMAYREGERNVGLQFTLEVSRACPEQYLLMLKEASGE